MNTANDEDGTGYRAEVDQQDGGPASHSGDDSGGEANDVASGGVSEHRNEDDAKSSDADERAEPEEDVHGDTDTVS